MKIRFSLRTLLVLLTITAFWLGYQLNASRRQRIAVEAIQASGGSVRYEYERYLENSEGDWALTAPTWLRRILGDDFFHNVVQVEWSGKCSFSVTELSNLKNLPSLDAVYLSFSGIDDTGLKEIADLHNLKILWLDKCDSVTDIGLANISQLCNLEELVLSGTRCTDSGAKLHIPAFTNLQRLDLDGIVETNDTAMVLCQLNELRFFNLRYVDNAEFDFQDVISYINARRPHCVVNYNGNLATNQR